MWNLVVIAMHRKFPNESIHFGASYWYPSHAFPDVKNWDGQPEWRTRYLQVASIKNGARNDKATYCRWLGLFTAILKFMSIFMNVLRAEYLCLSFRFKLIMQVVDILFVGKIRDKVVRVRCYVRSFATVHLNCTT